MSYVREDVPSNFLVSGNKPIEPLYVELNLQNVIMLTTCSNNPHETEIGNHLAALNSFLGKHSAKFEKILILDDFNVEIHDPKMKTFCEIYNLRYAGTLFH